MNEEFFVTGHDLLFKHPFALFCAGPSQAGKTYWTRKFLENIHKMVDTKFETIIWAYGQYQDLYSEGLANGLDIQYYSGVDDELRTIITSDPDQPKLLILDDLMAEVCNDKKSSSIFTKGIHHCNFSCIFLVQNLLYQAKESRTISLNCQYFVIFENKRDQKQVSVFASQLMKKEGKVPAFKAIFVDATRKPYSPLVIDVHPKSKDLVKFRSNVFAEEEPCALYLIK